MDTWIFLILAVGLIVAGALSIHIYTVEQKGDAITESEKTAIKQEKLAAHCMILVAGVATGLKAMCEYKARGSWSSK